MSEAVWWKWIANTVVQNKTYFKGPVASRLLTTDCFILQEIW